MGVCGITGAFIHAYTHTRACVCVCIYIYMYIYIYILGTCMAQGMARFEVGSLGSLSDQLIQKQSPAKGIQGYSVLGKRESEAKQVIGSEARLSYQANSM